VTLIIILNAVFAAFVLVGIVGLHLYAIAKDHSEHARGSLLATATKRPPTRHGAGERSRGGRREIGAVSIRRGRNRPGSAHAREDSALGQTAQ